MTIIGRGVACNNRSKIACSPSTSTALVASVEHGQLRPAEHGAGEAQALPFAPRQERAALAHQGI